MRYLLLILMCLPLQAVADDDNKFCVDGVWYRVLLPNLPSYVEVTAGDEKYSGSVEIPSHVTIIDGDISRTFWVYRIGDKAFKDCKDLTEVKGCAGIHIIGQEAFKNCVGLREVEFIRNNYVSSIGESAFENCTGISDVSFHKTIYGIGENAFRGCTSLKSVKFPEQIQELSAGAFCGCSELDSVVFDMSFHIDTIGAEAFAYCPKAICVINDDAGTLTNYFPENLKVIGERAFLGNEKMTEITLPHSLEAIEDNAFKDCPIKTVHCYATRPPVVNATAFDNSQRIRLLVPHAERYEQADTWKDFGTIEESPLPSDLKFTPYPPTIEYSNGQIHLSSMDDQVHFTSNIKCLDDGGYNEESVSLSATYHIWACAWSGTEAFSEESTRRHAYLAWIYLEPTETEIPTSISEYTRREAVEVKGLPVLIERQDEMVVIKGAIEGTPVDIYNAAGQKVASGKITGPVTNFRVLENDLIIVKIGGYSIKCNFS